MGCSLPGSSGHGIFQARILQWVAISFSRGSSWPRDQTQVSCTASQFFTNWASIEYVSCSFVFASPSSISHFVYGSIPYVVHISLKLSSLLYVLCSSDCIISYQCLQVHWSFHPPPQIYSRAPLGEIFILVIVLSLMAESEELKSLLMKVKQESEKAGLKLNIQLININEKIK